MMDYNSGHWIIGNYNKATAATSPSMSRPNHNQLRTGQWIPNGNPISISIRNCTGYRGAEIERIRIRNRSVRWPRREGEDTEGVFLQQVLLLHKHGNSIGSHIACIYTRWSRKKLGIWDMFCLDVHSRIDILIRDEKVQVQEKLAWAALLFIFCKLLSRLTGRGRWKLRMISTCCMRIHRRIRESITPISSGEFFLVNQISF